MLPLLLPDWLQRESVKNPYNVVSVPDPLIVLTICHVVLQCSTFTTVSVTLQIFLQSLTVDTASCCKNDGREACWLVLSLFFCHLDSPIDAQAWSPFSLIPRVEGFVVPLDPTNNDDKTRFVRHCQLQESQSIDLMVPVWVKAPLQKHLQVGVQLCGRPMLVVWVLA